MKKIIFVVVGIIVVAGLGRLGWAVWEVKNEEPSFANISATNESVLVATTTSKPAVVDVIPTIVKEPEPMVIKIKPPASSNQTPEVKEISNYDIKAGVANSRALAELFYDSNGASYLGVCIKPNPSASPQNVILSRQAGMLKSSIVTCKDSPTAWAISGHLINTTTEWCSDNTGVVVNRNSPITTTSCK